MTYTNTPTLLDLDVVEENKVFGRFAPTTLVTERVCLDGGRLCDECKSANGRLQNAVGTAKRPAPPPQRRKWGHLYHSSHIKNCLHGPRAITLLPASLAHPSLEFVRGTHMEVRRLWKSAVCKRWSSWNIKVVEGA
jgi:hypothetical protein